MLIAKNIVLECIFTLSKLMTWILGKIKIEGPANMRKFN